MSDKPVVVGVDGSDDSKRALTWAVEFGRRFESPVEAVISWQTPVTFRYPGGLGSADDAGLNAEATSVLDDTVRSVLGENAQVTKRVERGHPASVLVDVSSSAEALVVGSRGRGAFLGMLIGSVSQFCAQRASCPVVVIREQDDK